MREEIVRRGYAYVGVGVQWVGVASPQPPPFPGIPGSLIATDPARYGTLRHPGDTYSYDMFSQAAQALRTPNGPNPLGSLRPKRIVAMGESQSAGRMVTYINAIHPLADVYDGFFVHSRSASAAPLSHPLVSPVPGSPPSDPPTPDIPAPTPAKIRDLPGVPVFVFQTETDVPRAVGSERVDGRWYREWEVTGTAHGDVFLVTAGAQDPRTITAFICGAEGQAVPINAGPQTWAMRAALRHFDNWLTRGTPPPRGDDLVRTGAVLERDPGTGIARGGIRLPDVAVPTRTLSGVRGTGGNLFCVLFGKTDPWNGDTDAWDGGPEDPSGTPEPVLATLYPSHGVYVAKVVGATLRSVLRGFVLPEDADDFVRPALESDVGR
jgi:hypothetical protein